MSKDGGVTWQQTSKTINPKKASWNTSNYKITIDPNSTLKNTILYTNSRTDIWKYEGSSDGTGTWNSVYSHTTWYSGPLWFEYVDNRDIEVSRNGTVYFTNYLGLFSIAPNSSTPTAVVYSLPTKFQNITCNSATSQVSRQDINVEINNQGHIVFVVGFYECNNPPIGGENSDSYIYKSTDNGATWTFKDYDLVTRPPNHFVLSPSNSDIIYAEDGSGRCMQKSTDGGATFTSMNNDENHADVRIITISNAANTENDVLYLGTDGGISKTTNGMLWKDITGNGLSITNYYGIGITETNDKMIFAGAQDGNINYYSNGSWYETHPGGDNGDCLITGNDRTIIQESQNDVCRGRLNGNDVTLISSYSVVEDETFMNPLCLNPNNPNEFFVGIKKLKNSTINSTTLLNIYNSTLHREINISSVAMSKKNTNVVYYSLAGKYYQGVDNSGIFKAVRTSATSTAWTITDVSGNLRSQCSGTTPNVCGTLEPITDIVVDPSNENRAWVTFGGFTAGSKVYKTENGGTSWENVSGCLPNFPVISICYQEGSNDRLYVGTDIGVFYRDNVQTDWAKYGNDGPPCMVNDMEINNCAGKLVVATYGRGLWEAPLLTNVATEITTGSTTWNRNRTVASDIRVKKGATLKIEGTVAVPTVIGFGRGVRIIVEDGAKLEVTNATLTNACSYMWQGIEAWGDATATQLPKPNTPNKQSIIQLTNATIEYANNAITTWKVGDLTTTGAIIKATNSKFINNTRSVEYMKYKGRTPLGNPLANIGRFTNCSFTVNNGYRRGDDFKYHISEWEANAVFLGCIFKCERSFPYDQELNAAIRTLDAAVIVDADCGTNFPCGNIGRSTFSGFNKAVHSTLSKGLSFMYVDRSDFSDNAIGIHSEGANYIFARGDKFKVGKTGLTVSPDDIHEGIISMSSTALFITESTFSPTFSRAADPVTIGVRVRENGANDNSIYRNIFKKELATNSNKFYGNLANGINRNTAGSGIGLKYICNTHQNNVLNGFDIAVTDIGIELNQGSASSSAGNKFSLGTIAGGAPTGSDFKNSSKSNINYFHANSLLAEIPQNVVGITKILAKSSSSCPILYNPDEFDNGFTTIDDDYTPYSRIHAIVGSLLLDRDSINLIAIRLWLSRENNIENLMTTVETYLQEDNADLAEETLNEAITRFTLDEPTKKEFDYYVTLKRMQIRWIRSNTNIFAIPQSDLEVLRNLAENSSARAGDAARGLLNFAYHTQYFIPPTLPKETGGKGIEASERTENTTKINATNVTLIAFPNPASHIVNFEYHTQDRILNGAAEVVVRNTLGQVIKRFKMTSDGLISWNIESLEGGIYYYSLENAEKVIITAQQLIIAK